MLTPGYLQQHHQPVTNCASSITTSSPTVLPSSFNITSHLPTGPTELIPGNACNPRNYYQSMVQSQTTFGQQLFIKSENGYGSCDATFAPDMYFAPETQFIQNSCLFNSAPATTGTDYSYNLIKSDPETFFGHACSSHPFVQPHYSHFPFAVQSMTSGTPSGNYIQNPIQCQWVEVGTEKNL
uniref:Uncharacterized protein n=1 Tax=Wuchereria bancrofti TaxID=6293 RepID=A0AAF5RY54_WUCBA